VSEEAFRRTQEKTKPRAKPVLDELYSALKQVESSIERCDAPSAISGLWPVCQSWETYHLAANIIGEDIEVREAVDKAVSSWVEEMAGKFRERCKALTALDCLIASINFFRSDGDIEVELEMVEPYWGRIKDGLELMEKSLPKLRTCAPAFPAEQVEASLKEMKRLAEAGDKYSLRRAYWDFRRLLAEWYRR
jgi:hypothetical protein